MNDKRRKALERLRGFAYDAMAGERPDLIEEAVDEIRQALTEPAVPIAVRDLPECYYMLANNSIRLSDPCVAKAADKVAELLRTLAHIERQILYRDKSMPEWAKIWIKQGGTTKFFSDGTTYSLTEQDYRPDEHGSQRITLAIIEPPEGE